MPSYRPPDVTEVGPDPNDEPDEDKPEPVRTPEHPYGPAFTPHIHWL